MKHCAAAVMFALFCAGINAHGVEAYDATSAVSGGTRTARFVYSTGEPMSYAKTKLYPPSSPETEVLQSLCDINGYFSFIADEAGGWRITAEDGMGHKGEILIEVNSAQEADEPLSHAAGIKSVPLALRCVFGLSIILNVFAVYFFMLSNLKTSQKKKEARDAH